MVAALNARHHRVALLLFAAIVVAHWAEHLAQAFQIYAFGWSRPAAGGALGLVWPWLVSSEWMHYGYAVIMLGGLVVLRHAFTGTSRTWWNAAMWIQAWHHVEHLLLLVQASTGAYLLGASAPTSVAQLIIPRVELHLFYNTVVTVPMVVAMVLHRRYRPMATAEPACGCATRPRFAFAGG
ncbi:hypothetical protein [Pseudonocardia zijingensis]|uniref:hypothetical protein n=1 Tax=Pseudonocardia zijingensis TaxID=153376 RepID=UPI003612C362